MLPPDPGHELPARDLPGHDLQGVAAQLQRTQLWVRFLAILGFVWAGLMIVGGLLAGAAGAIAGVAGQEGMQLAALLFVYPLLGVLYIYPSLCLLRYANNIRRFVASPVVGYLEAALDAQRAFWKFAGILAIVSIVATILLFVFAMVIGIAAGIAGAAGA